MRLHVRDGSSPSPQWQAAAGRGLLALGDPTVDVVTSEDFDAAVRELTGSNTYSGDRGTGTVAAKTLRRAAGPVIVVNTMVMTDSNLALVERTLAHEAGHVLINGRGEVLEGRHGLATSEWAWQLLCVAGMAMHEVRCERAVGAHGYPATDGASAEHLVQVLHATTLDTLQALQDPACQDARVLMQAMVRQLDRLTKVLAYVATESLRSGAMPALEVQGEPALDAWSQHVAPTWERRLELYEGLPPATEPMDESAWRAALMAGASLEHDLLRCLGFEFENFRDGNFAFHRRVDNEQLGSWLRRGLAQEALYGEQDDQ